MRAYEKIRLIIDPKTRKKEIRFGLLYAEKTVPSKLPIKKILVNKRIQKLIIKEFDSIP